MHMNARGTLLEEHLALGAHFDDGRITHYDRDHVLARVCVSLCG